MQVSVIEVLMWAKFQVKIQNMILLANRGTLQGKFTKKSVSRQEQAIDPNSFQSIHNSSGST